MKSGNRRTWKLLLSVRDECLLFDFSTDRWWLKGEAVCDGGVWKVGVVGLE
jgi:hypothetical protein